jgi:hypothetical protein
MTGKPINDSDLLCPQFQKPLRKVCHRCAWYMQLRGEHPQTGQEVDGWDCAMVWQPILLVNAAREVHFTTATVDKLREENMQIFQANAHQRQTHHDAIVASQVPKLTKTWR